MNNQMPAFSMSVGRDYRLAGRYEYVIYRGEDIYSRAGCFKTAAQARRAGMKVAAQLEVA